MPITAQPKANFLSKRSITTDQWHFEEFINNVTEHDCFARIVEGSKCRTRVSLNNRCLFKAKEIFCMMGVCKLSLNDQVTSYDTKVCLTLKGDILYYIAIFKQNLTTNSINIYFSFMLYSLVAAFKLHKEFIIFALEMSCYKVEECLYI